MTGVDQSNDIGQLQKIMVLPRKHHYEDLKNCY